MSLKQQKNQHQSDHEQQQGSNKSLQTIATQNYSEFLQKYKQSMDDIYAYTSDSHQMIKQNSRLILNKDFIPQMQIETLSTDLQSINIMISYGYYKLNISVIWTNLQEYYFSSKIIGQGKFGIVNEMYYQQNYYAIKGIFISEENNKNQIMQDVYKQYFLYCLCGALGVGPKTFTPFGYDIIVTRKRAFFALQFCQKIQVGQTQQIQRDLLNNLKIMHSINLIHNDIKPENVAYSPSLKKYIFLDFGISRMIKQKLGEKTLTHFKGTLAYSSDENKKCFFLQKARQIDLYFNDLQSVKKTMCFIRKSMSQQDSVYQTQHSQLQYFELNRQKSQCSYFVNSIQIFRLKYYIFNKNIDQVQKIVKNYQYMPFTIYEILMNPGLNKEIKKENFIKNTLCAIKNYLIQINLRTTSTDQMLKRVFSSDRQEHLQENMVPVMQILDSSTLNLQTIINNVEFALKLYVIFDPFRVFQIENLQIIEKNCQTRRKIVQKLWPAIKSYKKIASNQILQSDKVRYTLIYFWQNLSQLKNQKILLQLRMLFIMIEDWKNVERLQNQIIKIYSSMSKKLLRICEFQLFWDINLEQFVHQKQKQWLEIVKYSQTKDKYQQQVKNLTFQILNRKELSQNKIQQKLQQIQQTEEIQIIKFLYKIKTEIGLPSIQKTLTKLIYSQHASRIDEKKYKKYKHKHKNIINPLKPIRIQLLQKPHNIRIKTIAQRIIEQQSNYQIFYCSLAFNVSIRKFIKQQSDLKDLIMTVKEFLSSRVIKTCYSIYSTLMIFFNFIEIIENHIRNYKYKMQAMNQIAITQMVLLRQLYIINKLQWQSTQHRYCKTQQYNIFCKLIQCFLQYRITSNKPQLQQKLQHISVIIPLYMSRYNKIYKYFFQVLFLVPFNLQIESEKIQQIVFNICSYSISNGLLEIFNINSLLLSHFFIVVNKWTMYRYAFFVMRLLIDYKYNQVRNDGNEDQYFQKISYFTKAYPTIVSNRILSKYCDRELIYKKWRFSILSLLDVRMYLEQVKIIIKNETAEENLALHQIYASLSDCGYEIFFNEYLSYGAFCEGQRLEKKQKSQKFHNLQEITQICKLNAQRIGVYPCTQEHNKNNKSKKQYKKIIFHQFDKNQSIKHEIFLKLI